jgi:hypothetical protein
MESVKAFIASEKTSILAEELLQSSKWAFAAADRTDHARSGCFIRAFEN